MEQIAADVAELQDDGIQVLSPSDPRVVGAFGDFLFVASDVHRAVKSLQDRHLAAIRASSFLWLVAPDGYVGLSTALEIGGAVMAGVPIYSRTPLADLTLRQYVRNVACLGDAVLELRSSHEAPVEVVIPLLLDPHGATERAHAELEEVLTRLTSASGTAVERDVSLERRIRGLSRMLRM